jgi:hypothetical protein
VLKVVAVKAQHTEKKPNLGGATLHDHENWRRINLA